MLVTLTELLKDAKEKGYAVGGFNGPTLESAIGAIKAAEELNIPFVLMHAQVHECYLPLTTAGPILVELAKKAKVPVCVHLDHGTDFDYCMTAMKLGFTSIMFDASAKSFEDNLKETKEMVKIAHSLGVSVEAELGHMPQSGVNDDKVTPEDFYTKPEEAKRFVEETGVDALAISFGTVHGIYKTEPKLSIKVVEDVAKAVGDVALVMHGGSGVSEQDFKHAIDAGIRKINYYTYSALAGGEAVYDVCKKQPTQLQFHDVAMAAQDGIKENVKKAMKVFANGKI